MVHTNATDNVADMSSTLACEVKVCFVGIPVNEVLGTVSAWEAHVTKGHLGIFLYMADML